MPKQWKRPDWSETGISRACRVLFVIVGALHVYRWRINKITPGFHTNPATLRANKDTWCRNHISPNLSKRKASAPCVLFAHRALFYPCYWVLAPSFIFFTGNSIQRNSGKSNGRAMLLPGLDSRFCCSLCGTFSIHYACEPLPESFLPGENASNSWSSGSSVRR